MTDFKPEVSSTSKLPRGFRPVRLNLNNNINQFNQPNEVIYDEPCSNYDSNYQQQPSIPPPIPSSQPPPVSSNINNDYNNNFISQNNNQPVAQPFWTLPAQEQQQLQQHLQEHISRSPTPTFGQPGPVNADNIQKVITDKEPPSNAEFLYETDAYKFYTVPKNNEKKVITKIKQQTNRQEIQGIGPLNEAGVPLTLRSGVNNRHKSDWYKTMYKNMHITDKPKWAYEEPVKVKKNKKAKKEKLNEPIQNEYIYDNHPPVNQYQSFQENERRKKEMLQREMEKEWGYICDEPETKYIIKKKKNSKSKSPVSRKIYANVQKGEDIPLGGLGKPAPKSKNKGFYDQKQKEQVSLISRSPSPRHESRSPTPILTYPASDYVPERPPTPQYIYSQHQQINQYNELNTQYNNQYNHNQFINQTTSQPSRQIYNQQIQQQKSTINKNNKKTDFTAIDEWQRKITDDFNQIYSNLERNFEIKRLRETGKLVSPIPPNENRKETGFKARDLYLDQQHSISPKPPSRAKYYLEPSKPLLANDLFNENSYKTTTTTTTNKYNTINTSRDWLDSTNKLNRYNSSQELNYLNPNNNRQYIDFNNNTIDNKSTFKKSIYQHNSLDNLNTLSNYEQPVHEFNYKIYAKPETTRTYTESTYIVDSNSAKPVIDHKTRTTTNTFQFQRQNSILDIERQLNETLGDLLRSTSSCCDNRNENINNFKRESPVINTIKIDNLTENTAVKNITRPKSPPIRQNQQAIDKELAKLAMEQSNSIEQSQQPIEEETIKPIEIKPVPFNLQPNQDVNNISFQTTEDDVDLDKLIKKIEQDAILQDEIENS